MAGSRPPRSPAPLPSALSQEVEAVLARRGADRGELLLESARMAAVVAALPPEELYFTLKDLDPADLPAVLGCATAEQVAFVLDLELWDKDAFSASRAATWLANLNACDPVPLARWLRQLDVTTWALLLGSVARVHVAADDRDPFQDLPGRAPLTVDGVHFLAVREAHEPLVRGFLHALRAADGARYGQLLEALLGDLDAEFEENCREERGRRLALRGLPEWEEAMEVYAKLEARGPDDLPVRPGAGPAPSRSRPPRYPLLQAGQAPDLLARALRHLEGSSAADPFRAELAYLTNKVVVADRFPLGRTDSFEHALRKVAAYTAIGLEALCGYDEEEAARLLERHWLQSLFRVGWTRVRAVRTQAQRLFRKGWPQGHKERLLFLDPPLPETVDGLLRPHPLWYVGDGEPAPCRLFRTLGEVDRAAGLVAKADFLGQFLLSVVDLRLTDLKEAVVRLDTENLKGTTVFLTALVNAALGRGFRFAPVARAEVSQALGRVWESDLPPRRVRVGLLESAVEWSQAVTPISAANQPHLREFVAECFGLLEDEFGRLAADELPDPRFTRGLWID